MKTLIRKFSRTAITVVLVILAFIAIFNAWVYYTESPWTRDARFSADVVAIAPDVSGLITQVNVHDNQLVKKGQILFTIDQPRYQKALEEAQADVAYYQVLAQEKRQEAGRRNRLGVQAMSREEIDQANNVLQTVLHQLAKAQATRDLAKLDLNSPPESQRARDSKNSTASQRIPTVTFTNNKSEFLPVNHYRQAW